MCKLEIYKQLSILFISLLNFMKRNMTTYSYTSINK